MLKKIKKLPGFFRDLQKITDGENKLSQYFRRGSRTVSVSAPLILVQCVEDPYYMGLFGQIVSSLRDLMPVRTEQFVLRSLNVGEGDSYWRFIGQRFLQNSILNKKWTNLYSNFCDEVGFRSSGWHLSVGDLFDWIPAYIAWRSLSDDAALIKLAINGIVVGDLVSDTFLRFKPAATVDLKSRYLLVVIWQAYCDMRRAKAYFSANKVSLYLTSYSTYTQHGIPVRAALHAGVRVFSFGNYQEFAKELSLQDWMHTKDAGDYVEKFSLLADQEEKLAQAEARLSVRLTGGVDAATAYMKESAYRETEEMSIDAKDATVIFLHDFFDSPNVYYDMLFSDFWKWACFTIETLKEAKIPFVIKPHPNQVGLSGEVIGALALRYPDATFVSAKITNKQLVDAGVVCAVTAYGTVAHEMAYLGVPSVTCARHPHIAFDFCITATNREQYAQALVSCRTQQRDKSKMRRQSLIFYYMHNMNCEIHEMQLLERVAVFRMLCARAETGAVIDELPGTLATISMMAGFQAWVAKWRQMLLISQAKIFPMGNLNNL